MVASPSALTSKTKIRLITIRFIKIILINIRLIKIIILIISSYLDQFMS